MKNKIFGLAILAMGFSAQSFAQASTSGEAYATIIAPITISKSASLNFGYIAAGSTLPTDVTVYTSGAREITNGGDAVLSTGGVVSAAQFTVSGTDGYQYTVGLPANGAVTLTDGASNSMDVKDFNFLAVNNGATSGTGLLEGGSDVLKVGATLVVAQNQPVGQYSGSFNVVVNYN